MFLIFLVVIYNAYCEKTFGEKTVDAATHAKDSTVEQAHKIGDSIERTKDKAGEMMTSAGGE